MTINHFTGNSRAGDMEETQDDKYITHNQHIDMVADRMCRMMNLYVGISSGNTLSLGAADFTENYIFNCRAEPGSPTLDGNWVLRVPAIQSHFAVVNNTAFTMWVESAGSPGSQVSIGAGRLADMHSDGATITELSGVQDWKLNKVWQQSVDGSAANVDFTNLQGAQDIMLLVRNVTKASSQAFYFRVSVNNGISYYNSSGDYVSIANTGVESAQTAGAQLTNANATAARSGGVTLFAANTNGGPKLIQSVVRDGTNRSRFFVASTLPVNAVRIITSGGALMTGGAIYCYIRR